MKGKAGSGAEFFETSNILGQRTRPQCSQRQVIDTSRSNDNSLMDEFRQPGKDSEGLSIGSSCGVSRKGAFSKDVFGEVEETRISESASTIRIPGYGNEVQPGTEVEFTEEVCGQVNQETYRAALSEYENSGFRKILTEEKIIEWSVESCGPDEHHAMEKIVCCHQSLGS